MAGSNLTGRGRRNAIANRPARLVLADGTSFDGEAFGSVSPHKIVIGEVVFNTAMSGYQEILTDPSYRGQLVCMTYPLIGNYGVNNEDAESRKIFLGGLIVRELSRVSSNWRSSGTLDAYLKANHIISLSGIDTRALTLHIRQQGAMMGAIAPSAIPLAQVVRKLKSTPSLVGQDLVTEVAIRQPRQWNKQGKYKVVVLDTGVKYNILRLLEGLGCRITIMPPASTLRQIAKERPNGVFLANGPGDPQTVPYLVRNVAKLVKQLPIFGICMGNQILGQALGAKITKLKFGHHGTNHPVMNLATKRVEITSQNHGFEVTASTLPSSVKLSHINLNDRTCEGLRHSRLPAFSVQYHPEAAPGPHDSRYLFDDFIGLMKARPRKAAG
jgi:carbamoyl-phosphate synthase small subunit